MRPLKLALTPRGALTRIYRQRLARVKKSLQAE